MLSNATGESTWAWTAASEGAGSGFTGAWADSDDAGSTWFTESSLYPLQASISVSAVPEPATWLLMLGGLGAVAGLARRRLA